MDHTSLVFTFISSCSFSYSCFIAFALVMIALAFSSFALYCWI